MGGGGLQILQAVDADESECAELRDLVYSVQVDPASDGTIFTNFPVEALILSREELAEGLLFLWSEDISAEETDILHDEIDKLDVVEGRGPIVTNFAIEAAHVSEEHLQRGLLLVSAREMDITAEDCDKLKALLIERGVDEERLIVTGQGDVAGVRSFDDARQAIERLEMERSRAQSDLDALVELALDYDDMSDEEFRALIVDEARRVRASRASVV